jgi:hypothetical protein
MSDLPPAPVPGMFDVPIDAGNFTVTYGADGRPIRHFHTADPANDWVDFSKRMEKRVPDPGLRCPYPECTWYVRGRDSDAMSAYPEHALETHSRKVR